VFVPALAKPLPLALTAIGAIWLFTLVNLVGARSTARFSGFALVAGLLPILAVGVFGWFWFDPKVFAASWNVSGHTGAGAVRASMISVFWAYTGFESAAVATAVVRDPQRNVPISTFAGTALAALVYIAASAAMMGLLPARELAASTAPFAEAVGRMLGPTAAVVVATCALIKTCGTLGGWVLVVAEAARAGADVHLFPGRLAPSPTGAVPRRIMLAMALVMSAAVLASVSPTIGKQFAVLINVSTVWTIIPYAICCLALWRLSAGIESRALKAAMRGSAAVAFGFNVWLVTTGDLATLWFTLALAAVTLALWLVVRGRASAARSAEAAI
jgi:arginine:agmatine antiporter